MNGSTLPNFRLDLVNRAGITKLVLFTSVVLFRLHSVAVAIRAARLVEDRDH